MSQSRLQSASITGIGTITPFSVGWGETFKHVTEGAPDYSAWNTDLDPPFENARLGLVKNFPRERYFNERQLRLMDKAMSMSSVAAAFAMEDAGILVDDEVAGRDSVATILASSRGEAASLYRFGSPLFRSHIGSVNPAHFPMIARNIACGQIAIRFGLRGWSSMIAAGDISGAHALARACKIITLGRANSVLVGAFEVLSPISLHQLKARWRKNGMEDAVFRSVNNDYVPVEGACFFVVESAQHAAKRGHTPYATITHSSQGYRFAVEGQEQQGWHTVLKRHQEPAEAECEALHICSSVTAHAGANVRQMREVSLGRAIAELGMTQREIRTRISFGDAGALTSLYGVATAAQLLRNSRATQRAVHAPAYAPAQSALVSALTERDAYSIFSLRA